MQNLKLTLIQLNLKWQDKDYNLNTIERLLNEHQEETDVIILPEMFTTGFSMESDLLAEAMSGKSVKWMKKKAIENQSAVCGSLIIEDNGKYVNRFIWVEPDGNLITYDKHHLFSLVEEHLHYTAGTEHTFINYKGWLIQPFICYDLRFPVWCRNTKKVDLQMFVANWPEKRSHHWTRLIETRSIENQCYVVGVNRIGKDKNEVSHSGDSSLYDYKGTCLHTVSNVEAIQTFSISKNDLEEHRKRYPFLKDQDNFEIL